MRFQIGLSMMKKMIRRARMRFQIGIEHEKNDKESENDIPAWD